MQVRPLSDRTPGHSSSFPTHAWIWVKARTQTSSPCSTSTATASALTVVLFLLARLPGCPHPAACRVTLTETYTTHRQSNVAPGLVHPRRVSATTPRDAVGSGLTRCGERSSCQSSSARARRGSKGPLQRAAREVEAAAATAPRHFSRAILCSLRAGLGISSTARSTESVVVQLSKQARVERGRPSRWQSWVPSAW